jgi:PPOX class probable F420-dependent enzyme
MAKQFDGLPMKRYTKEKSRGHFMISLPSELQQLLQKPVFAFIATLMPDGSPHLTQTWIDTDGQYLLINTVEGFQKVRNVQRDPRVTINVLDPAQPQHATNIRGRVVEVTKEGATEQFQRLIKRNLGEQEYTFGQPGQQRILLKIALEKIS